MKQKTQKKAIEKCPFAESKNLHKVFCTHKELNPKKGNKVRCIFPSNCLDCPYYVEHIKKIKKSLPSGLKVPIMNILERGCNEYEL